MYRAWTLAALLSIACCGRADLIFELKDGSQVKSTTQEAPLLVNTKFGNLSVPFNEIEFIQFGYRLPQEEENHIRDLIGRLGGPFKEREEASSILKKLGVIAYPYVFTSLQSVNELEVKTRLRQISDFVKDNSKKEDLYTDLEDRIVTKRFIIKGLIQNDSVEINNSLIGKVKIPIHSLKTANSLFGLTYKITQVNEWVSTGLRIYTDKRIHITASGNFDLFPAEPGKYSTGPLGSPTWGNNESFPVGALIGKFGEEGNVFLVGERVSIDTRSGELFLKVIPSLWPNANETGSYEVRIR